MRSSIHRNFRERARAARKRGLTLIETALALGITALVVTYLLSQTAAYLDQVRARAAADKIIEVHEASKGYIKAHFAALLNATAGGPVVIPSGRASASDPVPAGPSGLPSLQGGGFLSSSYVDTNGYGQRHSLIVRRQTAERLEALVSTHGGRTIPDAQLGTIASMVGASGGFVPTENVRADDSNLVIGAYGGWRTPINGWGPAASAPSAGRLAATLAFEDGNLLTDYLYRDDIGIPEANRMTTDIDMNGNEIHRVSRIEGHNGAIQIDGDVNITRNATVNQNVRAGQNVEAGIDVIAQRHVIARTGNVSADIGNVSAGTDVIAGRDLDVGRDAHIGRNLQVDGDATVTGRLKAGYLNLDAVVYNDNPNSNNRGMTSAMNVKLGDLLPRLVPQYSYRVTEGGGTGVPKPSCGGDTSRARIMLYRQSESTRGAPIVNIQSQMVSVNNMGSVVGRVWQGASGNYVDIIDSVYAVNSGLSWNVQWTGNAGYSGGSRVPRQVIAQTFCYFQ